MTRLLLGNCLCPLVCVQLRSCSSMDSSLYRSRYVSWTVDSTESETPSTAAQTATDEQPATSGSIPLLLISPPETDRGETNSTYSHQRSQSGKRKHNKDCMNQCSSSTLPTNTDKICSGDDEESDESSQQNLTSPEDEYKEDPSLLFHLPRSSPVISRRPRPLSWHGGRNHLSGPPSSNSPSPDSKQSSSQQSPAIQKEKPRSITVSSNLIRLLGGLTGHYPNTGQQGLAQEQKGWGLSTSDAPCTPGVSTSAQLSKERRSSNTPDFSGNIFKTSCELEKENAHFIVVDMVLEVLEGVKCTLSSDRDTSTDTRYRTRAQTHTGSSQDTPPQTRVWKRADGHQRACGMVDPKPKSYKRRHSDEDRKTSHKETNSNTQCTWSKEEVEEAGNGEAQHQGKTFSILSTDSGFEDCGVDSSPRDSLQDAEWLAQQLVLEFKKKWFPSHEPRRGRQSLRSSLQELPGHGCMAVSGGSLTDEIRLRTRMRGSLTWAPPRFQIIFNVQPTHRRSEVVALQHFLCAGCGTEVEPKYIKKLRYCDYLGRYFCDCCHSGSEAVIPGRVLSSWDFGRYSVSDFSKQLLDSVWHQPLFDLTCVGKTLYSRVKELDRFRELQEQLLGIKRLLTACRLSGGVVSEFEQLPAHLMQQPHLFSMDDLMRVKKGQLMAQARAVMHASIDHVEHCELCLARGFICEFCREKDIIFPFQSDICKRCTVCKACFHKHCFEEKRCPKCARIQSRQKRSDGLKTSDT
ncbi:protein associated with UVRAG as autophagy enhancer isoform X2 [Mugil cephalus]|uniref:protein associated with UVRAG as autophagy enhancer isoform X2 n=2 Tax=Mugil cephalus TaxID=48193 RepID=UPI001FB84773|nr:protein associated with UVRAG as autophagy enhancer isoform X2 [Mugil cephalus]